MVYVNRPLHSKSTAGVNECKRDFSPSIGTPLPRILLARRKPARTIGTKSGAISRAFSRSVCGFDARCPLAQQVLSLLDSATLGSACPPRQNGDARCRANRA